MRGTYAQQFWVQIWQRGIQTVWNHRLRSAAAAVKGRRASDGRAALCRENTPRNHNDRKTNRPASRRSSSGGPQTGARPPACPGAARRCRHQPGAVLAGTRNQVASGEIKRIEPVGDVQLTGRRTDGESGRLTGRVGEGTAGRDRWNGTLRWKAARYDNPINPHKCLELKRAIWFVK